MSRSARVHVISAFFVAACAVITHSSRTLVVIDAILMTYLLATREFAALRRCVIALVPVGVTLFAMQSAIGTFRADTHLSSPVVTVLRLCALFLTFTAVGTFFHGALLAERLAELGLRGEWLVITLSAVATLPLMQQTATRIVDARFAAGVVPSRSFSSRARQLPFVLRPLFTQALRVAIARSDMWSDHDLIAKLQLNLSRSEVSPRLSIADVVILLLSATCLFSIAGAAYL